MAITEHCYSNSDTDHRVLFIFDCKIVLLMTLLIF